MNQDMIYMIKKNSERGNYNIYNDNLNKVAVAQWYENKAIF